MCPLEQRREFILEWRSNRISKSALCDLFGISRQTGYKWARRFARSSKWTSLDEQSRRPHSSPMSTPMRLVKRILSMRRQRPTWGPVPIRAVLRKAYPREPWPSVSTFGAILKRYGLVSPRRRRYRAAPRSRPFSACRNPNDVWCVDFKGQFPTGDGRMCYPLTVMDGASRFLLACVGFHTPSLENVRAVFVELFRQYGLPKAIRSDNGEPFASVSKAAGLTELSAWWARLGIRLERIDPGKPQQNGRLERMHLTLKIETCSPPRRSLGWQQRAFDRFRQRYNHERPHQALGLATPATLYVPSTIPFPTELPQLHYPFGDVHLVKRDGSIRWRRRRFFISQSLAGQTVAVNTIDNRHQQVVFAGIVLGLIDVETPEYGLLRPKFNRRKNRSTQLSAISPV
jgi:putative transposase